MAVDWGSVIVYLVIVFALFHFYLKKTNQTFPEFIQKLKEIFSNE